MLIENILEKHHLVDTGQTLNGRDHIRRVLGPDGQALLLKTAKIDHFQVALLHAANQTRIPLDFKSQRIFHPQAGTATTEYLLTEYVEGTELKELYAHRLVDALTISEFICNQYRELIKECQTKGIIPQAPDMEVAYGWMARMFHRWIRRIMERRLLTEAEAYQIITTLFALAEPDPKKFFGYNHGNIHGEHVIVTPQGTPYLLDLTAEPRPGSAFYDHLRVLDFALLEHPDPNQALPEIIARVQKLKEQHDPIAVQAVWAFRCIGLLGADILGSEKRANAPDYSVREQIVLAMIRGQY